jgi:hypothetical protein
MRCRYRVPGEKRVQGDEDKKATGIRHEAIVLRRDLSARMPYSFPYFLQDQEE